MSTPTREKILDTALTMFNALGEPNVTTNRLADELGISSGNLYYHFRSKDAIVAQLFARHETRLDETLMRPREQAPTLDHLSQRLRDVFDCVWTDRFLYRDLLDILSRNRKLRPRFSRLLNRVSENFADALRSLADARIVSTTPDEIGNVSEHILLIATSWLNYVAVRGGKSEASQAEFMQGVPRAMRLVAPFVRDPGAAS